MAIYRVIVGGTLYNQEKWANVYHVNATDGFNHASVFNAFEAFYNTSMAAGAQPVLQYCPGTVAAGTVGVTVDSITLQAVTNPLIPEIRSLALTGAQNAAGGLPVDCSLVVSWRTTLAGRSYRGRTYLPPMHETFNADGAGQPPAPTVPMVTALVNQCAQLLKSLSAATAPLCIYSRKLQQQTIVTGGFIDSSWDTQRRRGTKIAAPRTLFVQAP